jgi:hypothetical protein
MPLEGNHFFFLRKDHAFYEKAGLVTVSAFRTYGYQPGIPYEKE